MPEWIEKLVIALGSIIAALGGRSLWEYLGQRKKSDAEAKHISRTGDLAMLQISEELSVKYMRLFNQAADELRQAREHQAKAANFIRKMLGVLKAANIENWEALEKEANELLG